MRNSKGFVGGSFGTLAPGRAGVARRAVSAGLSLALAVTLAGCGAAGAGANAGSGSAAAEAVTSAAAAAADAELHFLDTADLFTDRDLAGSYDEAGATAITLSDGGVSVDGAGATAEGSVVTISEEGSYVLSGTLADGQVVVDADGAKVQLVLAGASVTSADSAALYVRAADKVFVTLAEKTDNALATGGAYASSDDGVDGAVFSHDDLCVNGAGSLSVTSAEGHGVVGKDDVKLCVAGELRVEAAKSAINANDSVRVSGGSYTLVAGTDGVHAGGADDDADAGYVYVAGGTLDVTAGSDGFDAAAIMQVDGGELRVKAGDDGLHAEADLVICGGTVDVSESYEGLEGARVGVTGGDVSVVASDDGVNAVGDDGVNTAGDTAPTLDDADGETSSDLAGGDGPSAGAFWGDAAARPAAGGVTADGDAGSDAGAVGDGARQRGPMGDGGGDFGGRGGFGGGMEADASALIKVTGGTLAVDAGGDGLDSNGSLVITGGDVKIDGPVNTGNGALDYGTDCEITGGTLLATSAGGMEENAGEGTTQPTFLVSLPSTVSGEVRVTDASGAEVVSFSSEKRFNVVIVSSADLSVGETYTVSCDGTSVEVTLDETVSGSGTGMGGFGGGMGQGGRGQRGAATDDEVAPGDGGVLPGGGGRGQRVGADGSTGDEGWAQGPHAHGGPRGQRPGDDDAAPTGDGERSGSAVGMGEVSQS